MEGSSFETPLPANKAKRKRSVLGNPSLQDSKLRNPTAKSELVAAAQAEGEELEFLDVDDEFEEEDWVDEGDECESGEDNPAGSGNEEIDAGGTEDVAMGDAEPAKSGRSAWLPGEDLPEGTQLDYDPKTYHMLHHFELEWSCLSFDILPDALGMNRTAFPHSAYIVAGSQAEDRSKNGVYVVKMSNMYMTNRDADSDDSDGEDNDNDDSVEGTAVLSIRSFSHEGVVNRIRACPQVPSLVATWSDIGKVFVWDISKHFERLDNAGPTVPKSLKPKLANNFHEDEGFALDWDPHKTGQFLSGGCDGRIFLHTPSESKWQIQKPHFAGHASSVEDVAWKRVGPGLTSVFASCSVDKSVRLFDVREGRRSVVQMENAHLSDVNVISWCPLKDDLLLSGGDDGSVKVWDMRRPDSSTALSAHINWNRKPISSVDWHPADVATFASASLDNSVATWDLSVEPEDGHSSESRIPDQLMFLHMGQVHISEIKWHPQIPGTIISTAENGFNVYKAENSGDPRRTMT